MHNLPVDPVTGAIIFRQVDAAGNDVFSQSSWQVDVDANDHRLWGLSQGNVGGLRFTDGSQIWVSTSSVDAFALNFSNPSGRFNFNSGTFMNVSQIDFSDGSSMATAGGGGGVTNPLSSDLDAGGFNIGNVTQLNVGTIVTSGDITSPGNVNGNDVYATSGNVTAGSDIYAGGIYYAGGTPGITIIDGSGEFVGGIRVA